VLDEPLPDHSSLTRIRDRFGLAVFRCFFERVVELRQTAGLVWGKELIFDATKVAANAAVDSLVPRLREVAREHVDELFAQDGAEQAEPEPPPRRWDLLEECRLDPARPSVNGYQRKGDQRVSTTDADAAPMSRDGRLGLGYHDHHVVDGGRARVIPYALVTPADMMENQPMLHLLWRVRFRWRLRPRRAIGDTTYGTAENIRALDEAGIRAYVPPPDFDHRTPFYGASRFSYDAERDEYRCPEGQPLRRR
jgi:hypothetical protein